MKGEMNAESREGREREWKNFFFLTIETFGLKWGRTWNERLEDNVVQNFQRLESLRSVLSSERMYRKHFIAFDISPLCDYQVIVSSSIKTSYSRFQVCTADLRQCMLSLLNSHLDKFHAYKPLIPSLLVSILQFVI